MLKASSISGYFIFIYHIFILVLMVFLLVESCLSLTMTKMVYQIFPPIGVFGQKR